MVMTGRVHNVDDVTSSARSNDQLYIVVVCGLWFDFV